jgi:hypothetical protein
MPATEVGLPECRIPVQTLLHLRRAFRQWGTPLGAVHALHEAGYATGAALLSDLTMALGGTDPSDLEVSAFWAATSEFLSDRGWGILEPPARLHSGIGLLRLAAGAESDPSSGETQPSCAFTAGLLSHLLTAAAGGPIATLEIDCRSRGDEACRFLYGSAVAIHEVYGHLLEGNTLEEALARL